MAKSEEPLGIVADIGGTNARFAIALDAERGFAFEAQRDYLCGDFEDFTALVDRYLQDIGQESLLKAVIAVAGPVEKNRCIMTNGRFVIDACKLQEECLFSSCGVLNDFAALAASLRFLNDSDLMQIGPPIKGDSSARLVLGPGTGLGAAFLVPVGATHVVLAGEGGHVAFAPFDDLEVELWRWFEKKHHRVSAERILSGPGLEELHVALAQIDGRSLEKHSAKNIIEAGVAGEGIERDSLMQFCAMLGSFAGDLALAGGSWGGVYLAGGILPRLSDILTASDFRSRFEAKGRFAKQMGKVPTALITCKAAALSGAANYL